MMASSYGFAELFLGYTHGSVPGGNVLAVHHREELDRHDLVSNETPHNSLPAVDELAEAPSPIRNPPIRIAATGEKLLHRTSTSKTPELINTV